ncbi:MAG: cobalamin biosynthesis protein P47K [Acidobacteria bacterium]|nr:cobalamin biosynthesis protein P47K [Acidobacteriota bacterium]
MIGGFLGAGKTTAVLRLARHLREQGKSVGLITNDQSFGLVDTAMARSQGFSVEEITGGCFCCRFDSLVEAADKLSEESRPDVFIAEPVGSCTDLRAAVSYPLRRIYGDDYAIAPLSVLVDPVRAARVLGLEQGRSFSEKVLYVYDRQLAEADYIVINKVDQLEPEQLRELREALAAKYRQAEVLEASARRGDGLEAWFERIAGEDMGLFAAPDVDYETYAEGEALLGWMNATVHLTSPEEIDGNAAMEEIARSIAAAVTGGDIAHLKMTLTPDEDAGDIGVLNLVRNDTRHELAHSLKAPMDSGELIINLRAEDDPEALHAAAMAAVEAWAAAAEGRRAEVRHSERFRPAKPTPTYRMATV